MYRNLMPGALGVDASKVDVFALAGQAGFEGVDPDIGKLAAGMDPEEFREPFVANNLRMGSWGLPVPVLGNPEDYQEGTNRLKLYAEAASRVGANRCATWILPFSDTRDFQENFQFHVDRLQPCARILKDNNCRLGLEFIGPKTLRDGKPHEFIYTMDGMLELCQAIGTGNVGLLLDVWHLYTSHGSNDDVSRLTDDQIVVVHVNDAPAGIPIDEQMDNVRCNTGETGVIDIGGFLSRLKQIGYTGPVTPEPFSDRLRQMPPEGSIREAGEALQRAWKTAGIS